MYIRLTTFTYDPAQEEKARRIIDEQAIPALQKAPGFVSYISGLDGAARRGFAISVWETMEQAAGVRTALGGIIQQYEAAGLRSDPSQLYELTRQV